MELDVYKIVVRIPEGKRPLGRPRHRSENGPNIKIFLRETGCDDVGWIQLAQYGDQ